MQQFLYFSNSGGNKAASVEAAPPPEDMNESLATDVKYPNMPDFSQLQKIDYNVLKKITSEHVSFLNYSTIITCICL